MKKRTRATTYKQILAYQLVYIRGLKQREAARVMGIGQPAVAMLLSRLKERNPELFKRKLLHSKKK